MTEVRDRVSSAAAAQRGPDQRGESSKLVMREGTYGHWSGLIKVCLPEGTAGWWGGKREKTSKNEKRKEGG